METSKKFGSLDAESRIQYIQIPFRVVKHHVEEWEDEETHEKHVDEWDEEYYKIHPTEEECNMMSCYTISAVPPQEAGCYFTQTDFGDLSANVIWRRHERHVIPVRMRKWTPLTIKRAAKAKGWWESLHGALVNADLLEDFWGAQFIAEDDPDFPKIYDGMVALFGKTEVDEFLEGLEQA